MSPCTFSGTKTLNRIQSIVFDVAYYTSENLLISAPTGAGKTNIAMLTVLREIKNNIENGVIKRDNFKVQREPYIMCMCKCISPACSLFLFLLPLLFSTALLLPRSLFLPLIHLSFPLPIYASSRVLSPISLHFSLSLYPLVSSIPHQISLFTPPPPQPHSSSTDYLRGSNEGISS